MLSPAGGGCQVIPNPGSDRRRWVVCGAVANGLPCMLWTAYRTTPVLVRPGCKAPFAGWEASGEGCETAVRGCGGQATTELGHTPKPAMLAPAPLSGYIVL